MDKLATINIKGKEYVQVKDRISYLANSIKDYSVETDFKYFPERKMWVVTAKLTIGENSFSGMAQEIESDNYKDVNHSSALENCETSAVGRACAMAGIGIVDSIASADEVNKASNRGGYNQPQSQPKGNYQDAKQTFSNSDDDNKDWLDDATFEKLKPSFKGDTSNIMKAMRTKYKVAKKYGPMVDAYLASLDSQVI